MVAGCGREWSAMTNGYQGYQGDWGWRDMIGVAGVSQCDLGGRE